YTQDRQLIETGKLSVIDNSVTGSTGTVLLQATFANADQRLWPGKFVRATLTVSTLQDVVTVPSQAIMAGSSGSYVYVIDDDNKVHRVDVEPGLRHGGITVVSKVLSGGEKIVTDGQYRLANGVTVGPQQSAEPAAPQARAQAHERCASLNSSSAVRSPRPCSWPAFCRSAWWPTNFYPSRH